MLERRINFSRSVTHFFPATLGLFSFKTSTRKAQFQHSWSCRRNDILKRHPREAAGEPAAGGDAPAAPSPWSPWAPRRLSI